MITPERDLELMQMAFDLSLKCEPEPDGRVHPKVGAVIVSRDGKVLATGYRGETTLGNHAEQEAIDKVDKKLRGTLRDAVVYTTLEPCNVRGKQEPCVGRLLTVEVGEVVIGILDPNPDIRGRAWWRLEGTKVKVRNFDHSLATKIRTLNAEFINYQLGLDVLITSLVELGSANHILVTHEHRHKSEPTAIATDIVAVHGTFRVRPSNGDRLGLFVRKGYVYYPQRLINFDQPEPSWVCSPVFINTEKSKVNYEIIVARYSEDLAVAVRHYSTVHDVLLNVHNIDDWPGIKMNVEPPGFERLDWISVSRPAT